MPRRLRSRGGDPAPPGARRSPGACLPLVTGDSGIGPTAVNCRRCEVSRVRRVRGEQVVGERVDREGGLEVGGNRLDDFRRNLGSAPGPASRSPEVPARKDTFANPGGMATGAGLARNAPTPSPSSRWPMLPGGVRRDAHPVRDRPCPRRPLPTSTRPQRTGPLVARPPAPAARASARTPIHRRAVHPRMRGLIRVPRVLEDTDQATGVRT